MYDNMITMSDYV